MSLFKRVGLAVSAQVERLVGEIENHDAVVEAGLRESRRLFAKAKVRHGRLQQDGEVLRRRLEALRADEQTWRDRALGCDSTAAGEDKALQCLSRARKSARQAASLEPVYQQHQGVERRLSADIDKLRERVCEMEHRRSLMRSREATAAAAARIRDPQTAALFDLDETFERWEVRLTEAEFDGQACVGSELSELDLLEAEFVASEERASLQAELEALRSVGQTQQDLGCQGGAR